MARCARPDDSRAGLDPFGRSLCRGTDVARSRYAWSGRVRRRECGGAHACFPRRCPVFPHRARAALLARAVLRGAASSARRVPEAKSARVAARAAHRALGQPPRWGARRACDRCCLSPARARAPRARRRGGCPRRLRRGALLDPGARRLRPLLPRRAPQRGCAARRRAMGAAVRRQPVRRPLCRAGDPAADLRVPLRLESVGARLYRRLRRADAARGAKQRLASLLHRGSCRTRTREAVPARFLGVGLLQTPQQYGAGERVRSEAARLAAGKPILADGIDAEQLALDGRRVWIANPLDAFSRRDQRLYLDWLDANPAGDALLRGATAVVVARGSKPQQRLEGDRPFRRAGLDARAAIYVRV